MKKSIILFAFICTISLLNAAIINVPDDQPTIQEGIDFSADGDTVLVQPGIYFENINYSGKNISVASLYLTTQDTSYISQTVLDGNENGSVVTFENGENSSAVLCGLTIQNGTGKIVYTYLLGGGIYCLDSNPYFDHLKVINNTAKVGGGIYINNTDNQGVEVIINDCLIQNNETLYFTIGYSGKGGGICSSYTNLRIINTDIIHNSSEDNAGAILISSGDVQLTNVKISQTYGWGSTIEIQNANFVLDKCEISKSENIQYSYENLIFFFNCVGSINNCTIADNNSKGLRLRNNCDITVVNSIIHNDDDVEIYFDDFSLPNIINVTYSNIEGGIDNIDTNDNGTVNWLEGNIGAEPLFIDPENGNYHLFADSPCIDAGTAFFEWNDVIFIDLAEDEYYNTAPDMGAYEWVGTSSDNEELVINNQLSNYPNPFNPSTTISFDVPQTSTFATVEIYNIKGQMVDSLPVILSGVEGRKEVIWNAEGFSSGVYFYKLNIDDSPVKKMLLMK